MAAFQKLQDAPTSSIACRIIDGRSTSTAKAIFRATSSDYPPPVEGFDPTSRSRHTIARIGIGVASCAALALLAAAQAGPILNAGFGYPAGEAFYDLLWPICHQYPTRSIWIFGQPCGLCARCMGGYLGIALVGFWIIFRAIPPFVKLFSLGGLLFLLGIADAAYSIYSGNEWSNATRLATGMLGGAGVISILAATLERMEHSMRRFLLGLATLVAMTQSLHAESAKLPGGTIIILQSARAYNSEELSPSSSIDFIVLTDVVIGGHILIKAGSLARGSVETLQKAGMLGKEGQLTVAISSVQTVDGQNIPTIGNVSVRGEDEASGTIVASLLLCPLFLVNKGGDASISAGTQARAFTLGDVMITLPPPSEPTRL